MLSKPARASLLHNYKAFMGFTGGGGGSAKIWYISMTTTAKTIMLSVYYFEHFPSYCHVHNYIASPWYTHIYIYISRDNIWWMTVSYTHIRYTYQIYERMVAIYEEWTSHFSLERVTLFDIFLSSMKYIIKRDIEISNKSNMNIDNYL